MTPMSMQKSEAIRLLGGSITEAAKECRVTPQAVSGWPELLTDAIEDRVVAALARKRVPGLLDDARRDTQSTADPQPTSQAG